MYILGNSDAGSGQRLLLIGISAAGDAQIAQLWSSGSAGDVFAGGLSWSPDALFIGAASPGMTAPLWSTAEGGITDAAEDGLFYEPLLLEQSATGALSPAAGSLSTLTAELDQPAANAGASDALVMRYRPQPAGEGL